MDTPEVWIVQKRRVGADDYPVGEPYDKVGPFPSYHEAKKWIDEVYPMIGALGKRQGLQKREVIEAIDPLFWCKPPDIAKKRAGK